MDILKKIWAAAFAVSKKDTKKFVITLIAYILIGAVMSVLSSILSFVPILGLILWIISSVVDLYCFIGLILTILVYLEVIKDNGAATTEEATEENAEESTSEESTDNE